MTLGPQGGAQVEKALDDLVQRLSKADSTAEVRAALIEARRLRNVTLRWGAIPPPPDARREMMSRVMVLVAKAGAGAASSPPPAPAPPAPPSGPLITVERPPVRALSPFGGQLSRPAATPPAPAAAPLPGDFRSNPEVGMTRARANGGLPPTKPRLPIGDYPELDAIAPPRAAPPPLPPRAHAAPARNLSPIPGVVQNLSPLPAQVRAPVGVAAAIARGITPSAPGRPIPSLKKEPSPLPAVLRVSNTGPAPRRATAAGLRPIGGATPEPTPPPAPASDPQRKKFPTLDFASPSASPHPPAAAPRHSTARPLSPVVRQSQPPTPRVDPTEALRAISSAANMRSRSPHRAHTIAGIPEANEAFLAALRKKEPIASEPPEPEEESPQARSNRPTAAPPPPSKGPISTGAPPPLRRGAAKATQMMGSINAADTLEALRGGRAPVFGRELGEDEAELDPPIIKPSNPANLAVPVSQRGPQSFRPVDPTPQSRRPSGTLAAVSPSSPAILAIPAAREGRLDGFSSAVSGASMASVSPARKQPSSPTQIMGSPPPPSMRATQSHEKPLRTVINPGVTIVRPDAAQWQPHPVSRGATIKLLFRDPRSGVYTALVRLAPGSSLGRRRHAAAEEMLLVSGIATVGQHEMRAGEYCRAEADTVHDAITTSTGCTFFLCGSENDEFLDDA